MASQPGFFDLDERYSALSKANDPLERVAGAVHFEGFRPSLMKPLRRSDRSKDGRPPFDAVLMFKILVLQALYNLSDDQAEYQIRGRLSFMRFLGLSLHDRGPDATPIWLFRELLVRTQAIDGLFDRFEAALQEHGYPAMSGQIVDATIVSAPKQRNNNEEKTAIKQGEIPEDWADTSAKLGQKDRDAGWTMKPGRVQRLADGTPKGAEIMIPAFGYKSHISTDKRHSLIRKWVGTHAAANDGKQLISLIDSANTASPVWADMAYRSENNEAWRDKFGRKSMIRFRKPRGKVMSKTRKKANAARSTIRSAVEHVFAHQKGLIALPVRIIGLERAKIKIGMANLAYNMRRLVWLDTQTAPA